MSPSSAVGILYPGERMDMLVEWPQVEAESNLAVILDTEYILPLLVVCKQRTNITNRNYIIPNKALTSTQHFPILLALNSRLSKRGHPHIHTPATSETGTFDLSTLNGSLAPS